MAVFSEPPKPKTLGPSIGELLELIDQAKTPDESKCRWCSTRIVADGEQWADALNAGPHWAIECYIAPTGPRGSTGYHSPGYVDDHAVTEAYERLTAAVRKLPRHVLGLLGE